MFYTYTLTDPRDLLPFYVGKGKGMRMFVHEKQIGSPKAHADNPTKMQQISEILDEGLSIMYSKVDFESEAAALNLERELIEKYGRRFNGTGILTNLCAGGAAGGKPAIPVSQYELSGPYIATFVSAEAAEEKLLIDRDTIRGAASPARCLKSAGGFQWSYEKLGSMPPYVHNLERAVDQYDKKGVMVQSFATIAEASSSTDIDQGNISGCCAGELKTAGGFVWRHKGEEFSLSTHKASKRVDQYDLTTKQKIQTFDSMKVAASVVGCDPANVVKACQGKLKSAGGFGWTYEGEEFTYSKLRSSARQVQKLDKITGDVLQTYDSIGIAAAENNMYTASISQCCAGKLKSAGGFIWKSA